MRWLLPAGLILFISSLALVIASAACHTSRYSITSNDQSFMTDAVVESAGCVDFIEPDGTRMHVCGNYFLRDYGQRL